MDRVRLKESLSERSTEYITNICKYLRNPQNALNNKKSKEERMSDFKYLKICCDELVSR